jgi:cytochrome bd-type quinol oxidase subunit 2
MTIRIKRLLISLVAFFGLAMPFAVSATISAQVNIEDNLCDGASLKIDGECDAQSDETGKNKINGILEDVINIFSLVVGVISVVMIIVGGLKYITSGGDSGNVTGAKNTILYAVVGLVVVALAQFIVKFVLNRVASSDGTDSGDADS